MEGSLSGLFWKPKIDVIGRTKFWFREREVDGEKVSKVYFYDESWEMSTVDALKQILTPGK